MLVPAELVQMGVHAAGGARFVVVSKTAPMVLVGGVRMRIFWPNAFVPVVAVSERFVADVMPMRSRKCQMRLGQWVFERSRLLSFFHDRAQARWQSSFIF
jgi:hypothetical protein